MINDYERGLEYVIKHSKPHGLETECVEMYIQFCTNSPPKCADEYYQHANDALYEWDI